MTAIIRLASEDDAEQISAIYAPYVTTMPTSFELVPPTGRAMRDRITQTLDTMPWIVCEEAGMVLGYVYASPHRARSAYRWSVDVTAYIHDQHHRHGIGRALYTSLFQILTRQGFYNAFAGITLPNASSVGLHEAMGFVSIGTYRAVGYKLGHWHDVGWWQLTLRSYDDPPREPVTLASVQADARWRQMLDSGLAFLR